MQEALDAAEAKITEAAKARMNGERPLEVHLEPDEDDGLGGIPIKIVPSPPAVGSMNGAGAAGEPHAPTPPTRPAPAASSDLPSGVGLDKPAGSPAPRKHATQVREREQVVLAALAERPMSCKALAVLTGSSDSAMRNAMAKMRSRGLIEPTMESAFDWPGANTHAHPGKLWRLTGPVECPVLPEKVDPPQQSAGVAESQPEREIQPGTEVAVPEPVVSTPAEPVVQDPFGGGAMSFDEVFEMASSGMAEVITEEWMHEHAQKALLEWARWGQPHYFEDDPAADAYLKLLLKRLEAREDETELSSLMDRIERVIWGHTLKDGGKD